MKDLSFFKSATGLSLAEIAAQAGATVPAGVDHASRFDAAVALVHARPGQVAALCDDADLEDLAATSAGACLVTAEHAHHVPSGTIALVTRDPLDAFHRVALALHPTSARAGPVLGLRAPTSSIHDDARLEPGVVLDPGVVVGAGAEIGARTFVGAHTIVGPGVRIGRDCTIDAHVTIANALIGDGVVLQSGARIGYAAPGDAETAASPRASIGRVIVQNGVEVGVNAAIPRGAVDDTVIGEGSIVEGFVLVAQGTTVDRRTRVRRIFP